MSTIKRKSVPLIGQSAESFQIGPLSPSLSDSLTNGTSIPPPDPPTPPPKDTSTMDHPSTPPPQQQQNTLSDATYKRYFPSDDTSSSDMPGSFPTEDSPPPEAKPTYTSSKLQKMGYEVSASASPSPYAPTSHPSAASQSPGRPSSVFRLFPFKRRHGDRTSSSGESISSGRPKTPGAESVVGSLAESGGGVSLKKKMSGSFWGRRKSSLSFVTGAEAGGANRNGHAAALASTRQRTMSGNSAASAGGEAVFEGDEEEFPPRLKKKKSLTFWRRTSSLGLDRMGPGYGREQQPTRNGSVDTATNGYQHDGEDTVMSEPDPITLRPRSPPPKLPEVGHVVHEQGGLMGGEDWFGNIR
ncbi:MAG: hypothetical protein L6R40_004747 [Gallowayella cf. fulva]|nr:MAG: hypothetical protein L6R40_004747 [Xanthomendoza cf. fulva]